MAAVLVLLRLAHHLRAHRIKVDVADQLAQILIRLTENCLVSPLEEMSHLSIFPVVVLTKTRQDAMHDAADRVRLSLDQQVHVVRHQTISVKKEWQPALLHLKQREELQVIDRVVEDNLAIIAASDQVIKTALDFDARLPGHGRMLSLGGYGRQLESQNRRPDPVPLTLR